MYFGNVEGVLEFDGAGWRTIPVANDSIVRSLSVAADGTLYVGAVSELGYLARDPRGALSYVSLVEKVPEELREFNDVWRTHATDDGVYFFVRDRLLRYHEDAFTAIEVNSNYGTLLARGRLYFSDPERGLQRVVGDRVEDVPGGEGLAESRAVTVLLSEDGERFLVGTIEGKVYKLTPGAPSGSRLVPVATGVEDKLKESGIYAGSLLPDGSFALGTVANGLVILTSEGTELHYLDRSRGLEDSSVWTTFVDRQGGLWLGLNRGLARVQVGSSLTSFGESSGIEATLEGLVRHRGVVYACSNSGLSRLENRRFVPLGIKRPCWSLLSFVDPAGQERLLVGTVSSVFEIDGDRAEPLMLTLNAFALLRSLRDPGLMFVGSHRGLSTLRLEDGEWQEPFKVTGVEREVRSLAEDPDGRLWVGTHYDGLVRVSFEPGEDLEVQEVTPFGLEQGLPNLKSVKLLRYGDEILAGTQAGLYRLDRDRDRFVPSPWLGEDHRDRPITRLAQDVAGNLWVVGEDFSVPMLALNGGDGTFRVETDIFNHLPLGSWNALLPEADGVGWLGGSEGLYRLETQGEKGDEVGFDTLIRKVALANGETLSSGMCGVQEGEIDPLPHEKNDVFFEFSAPSFEDPTNHRFRYQLVGYDPELSPWSSSTQKEYTNLPEGSYRFRVLSKNSRGLEGREASFAFEIRPPWYRSGLAYSSYVALMIGMTYLVSLWRFRHLARERDRLEAQSLALERSVDEKISQIKILEGLLPICASCKKIRDEDGDWSELETYIDSHSEAQFSHGICPDCFKEYAAEAER
ncbi:MAG: two-component regulator propeller domain-containing protein [Acidobacteriota bacterium]